MRLKFTSRLLLLALGTCLAPAWSASAPGHFPDPINAPLLRKNGEIRLSASLGQKGEGVHVKGSSAVNDRIALMAAGSYAQQDNCPSCNVSVRRHFEFGVGRFDRTGSGLIREIYAGAGTGRFKASGNSGQWDPEPEEITVGAGHYDQIFLQTEIGKRNRYSTFGGAARLSGYRYSRFTKMDGNGTVLPVVANPWGLYLEPALTYDLGFRNLKTETQFGISIPLVEAEGIDGNRVWFSLGLGLNALGG